MILKKLTITFITQIAVMQAVHILIFLRIQFQMFTLRTWFEMLDDMINDSNELFIST